jgi:hypothetical protein
LRNFSGLAPSKDVNQPTGGFMGHVAPFLLLLILCACQGKESAQSLNSSDLDLYANSIEAGLTGVGGASDDVSNEPMVAEARQSFWSNLLISEALAGCSRNLTNDGSGNCVRDVNCDYGAYLWSGNVTMSFSNGSVCSLTGSGDSFTRLVDFARTGARGILQTTSNDRVAWTDETIGGGMTISQVDATGNLELEVLGQHKILTRNGRSIFDVSFKTSTPLLLNKLARNGRVISEGSLVIQHNRVHVTAEHSVNDLAFSSDCCYPVSGGITSTFSGNLNGSGSVSFHGCGNFTVTLNGQEKSYSMANCE